MFVYNFINDFTSLCLTSKDNTTRLQELSNKELLIATFTNVIELYNNSKEEHFLENVENFISEMERETNNIAMENIVKNFVKTLQLFIRNNKWDKRIKFKKYRSDINLNIIVFIMDLDYTLFLIQNGTKETEKPISEVVNEHPSNEELQQIQENIENSHTLHNTSKITKNGNIRGVPVRRDER